jgi:hypothetical protein
LVAGLFLRARSAGCEVQSAKMKGAQAKQKIHWPLMNAEKNDQTKIFKF